MFDVYSCLFAGMWRAMNEVSVLEFCRALLSLLHMKILKTHMSELVLSTGVCDLCKLWWQAAMDL
jgi:hypothetical protein